VRIYSLALFKSPFSAYEHPNCGEAQGKFFINDKGGFFPAVIRAFHVVFGGDWELWIHHDDAVRDFAYFKVLERMHERGLLKLIPFGPCTSLTGIGGMMERMRPIFDDRVKYVACRDVDSLPQPRERVMLGEWMASGAMLHAIHDSISHCGLMGGTLGVDAEQFRKRTGHKSLESLMLAGQHLGLSHNVHGDDQRFLNAVVYPYLAPTLFIHTKRRDNTEPLSNTNRAVAPCVEPLDMVAHVGGAFSADTAMAAMPAEYAAKKLIEECEVC
jgi:hypothetical protein